jgi:hypothetical protein
MTLITTQPLLGEAQLVYLYDGTLEGMLSAVFSAFQRKEDPREITVESNLQQSLLQAYIPIATDVTLAERVQAGILRELGNQGYEDVKRVFLGDDDRKGGVILRFLQYTLSCNGNVARQRQQTGGCGQQRDSTSSQRSGGSRSQRTSDPRSHLAHPAIADFEALLQVVNREAHHLLQFIRFAQLDNGVFFARIHPKASVVPLIMEHFVSRFNIQPFLIYDETHGLAGVYDRTRWWLVEANELTLPGATEQEDDFQSLWQTFYDTIAIEERYNPSCRRNFMPKRFWGDLCEMIPRQLRRQTPQTATPTTAAKAGGRLLPR